MASNDAASGTFHDSIPKEEPRAAKSGVVRPAVGVGELGADAAGGRLALAALDGHVAGVVLHDEHHRRAGRDAQGDLLCGHQEVAVAQDVHHRAIVPAELGADGGRDGPAH
jgi:hypothetical protein